LQVKVVIEKWLDSLNNSKNSNAAPL
jgi:hypothetical protein